MARKVTTHSSVVVEWILSSVVQATTLLLVVRATTLLTVVKEITRSVEETAVMYSFLSHLPMAETSLLILAEQIQSKFVAQPARIRSRSLRSVACYEFQHHRRRSPSQKVSTP